MLLLLTGHVRGYHQLPWREAQTQLSLREVKDFDSALPFSDESALGILDRLRSLARRGLGAKAARPWSEPDWQYHVTLNRFDGSTHVSFLFYEQPSAGQRALEKDQVYCLRLTERHTAFPIMAMAETGDVSDPALNFACSYPALNRQIRSIQAFVPPSTKKRRE
jgi:hypothetical protein